MIHFVFRKRATFARFNRSKLAEVANHVEPDSRRGRATSNPPTLIKIRRATYFSVEENFIKVAVKFQGRVASESPSSSRSAVHGVSRLRKLSWQVAQILFTSRYFVPNNFSVWSKTVSAEGKTGTRYVLVARQGLFVVSLLRRSLRLLDGTLSTASSSRFLLSPSRNIFTNRERFCAKKDLKIMNFFYKAEIKTP